MGVPCSERSGPKDSGFEALVYRLPEIASRCRNPRFHTVARIAWYKPFVSAQAQAGVNPFAGLVPSVPEGQQLFGETGPGSPTFAAAEELGMAELSKCCFCLVAGGLGERLGFPGIKIGIVTEVITGTTFIELFCSYILACQSYARTDTGDSGLLLPLAIMTSGDTHDKTVHMMRENDAWISFKHLGFGTSNLVVPLQSFLTIPGFLWDGGGAGQE